jgi:ABC-2 type transport system permease protein
MFLRRWLALLKGFGNILVKELKELVRDPKILLGMIIVPLIIFPVLGAVMSFSMESATEQAQKATVVVLDNDKGNYSAIFIESLNHSIRVFFSNETDPAEAVSNGVLSQYNTTQLIVIPKKFSENMTRHLNGTAINASVRLYSVFSSAGMLEGISSSMIDDFVIRFNRQYAPDLLLVEKSSIIKGEIKENVDPRLVSTLMLSQAIAMPITIMILLTYSMQIAATSVAMEKEEKTLETLLSLPVDRFAVLMGKLSGSILVAGVGAVAYMIGFNYYMGSFSGTISAASNLSLVSLGLAPSLFGYLLLGASLFVTLLSALALAVILSAFAEDVRSAQSLVGYVYPFLFVPSILLMYVDINTLPSALRIALYAIPYTHPIIASKAVTMGDYATATFGIVYVAAFTVIIMYVASRLFATEKILTVKLRFKGLRKRGKTRSEEL